MLRKKFAEANFNFNKINVAEHKIRSSKPEASPGRSSRRRVPGNALARFGGSDVAGDAGTPRTLCSHKQF